MADTPTQEVAGEEGNSVQEESTKVVITTDDVIQIIEDKVQALTKLIPQKDKQAMMNLVLGNVSMADIRYLVSLASDGISGSDIAEAKRIALASFDDAQLEQVRGYYHTYKHLIP